MEAVLIAGGLGTRLWPLTTRHPKHLLPVAGIPFVAHQICKLAAAGFDHVVLATSYLADAFEPTLGDGSAFGLTVSYVTESEPLGTGGAIRNVLPSLASAPEDPVVVLNGDQLSGHDLSVQLREFEDRGADASLHLIEVSDPRAYGCVPTDDAGWVTAFLEKSPHPVTVQVNAGCYVLRRRVIELIPPGEVVSVERETFPALLREGRRVTGYVDPAYWLDVGTPAALTQASRDVVTGAVSSAAYRRPAATSLVDPAASVDTAAVIGGGASIGPRATVGAGAEVDGSIVMPGATVSDDATVTDSVVGRGSWIGTGTVLRGAAVGDDATVGAGCELVGGVRIACGARISDGSVRFSGP